ncbi:MAG: BolA family transcriptional regulator [Rickettsiaceae bacterium]|nr:BolA family transcriptional regulator [Rickettsiaceae bacterium]
MNRKVRIEQKLSVLKPHYLEIIDDSKSHIGHSGNPGDKESHLTIKLATKLLAGKKRIEQHKIINELLKEEFANGLHALSIKIGDYDN